jgi:hypothetical protein
MKIVVVFILALTLSGPVLASSRAAAIPTTEAACKEAGMKWKGRTGECKPRSAGKPLSPIKKVIGVIGLGCGVIALYLLWGRRDAADGEGC